MHKPEEPLPLPFHVRIFVIIPFSATAALTHPTPATRKATAPGEKATKKLSEKASKYFGF